PPLQQPFGQVTASQEQTPVVVSHRPFAQDPHAAPPFPHCEDDSDEKGTHVKPLQQPFAHEVASQTHWPVALLHSCPDPHAPQLAPAVPHELFDSEAYSSHVLPLQQPLAHEWASQMHCPVLVLQSLFVGHAPQVTPPAPHDVFDSPESG